MAGALGSSDRARLERAGVVALSEERGLELFDVARGVDRALLLPMPLEMAALRAQAKAGVLPAVLRGLVRVPVRQASERGVCWRGSWRVPRSLSGRRSCWRW